MVHRSTLDSARHVTNDSAEVTMQDDIFPAAEKILSDIENVVKKDSSLKSFEIVPAEDNENKSPVFHQEECLGLASWSVQPLYCYAYRRLLELRQNRHRREEPSTVARWLLGALLLNPDVTTFWNMRRELVRSHKLDPSQELSFARLVLYHKPKCFEAFAYRRWLLPYILDAKEERQNVMPAESPLCVEMEIAGTCADRYANNYHAWSHRRHVMTLRESRGYAHPSLESEWKNSLVWCQRHVSDYSGLSYRQFLLRKYMFETRAGTSESLIKQTDVDDTEERREELAAYVESSVGRGQSSELQRLFDALHAKYKASSTEIERHAFFRALSYWAEECKINESTISMFNDHEALWYHRRFLIYLLLRLIASYRKYSCYKEESAVSLSEKKTTIDMDEDVLETSLTDDPVAICHNFLAEGFRNRSQKIIELASKRDQHEKMLVERFVKFLAGIEFTIES
ncbi:hypothetical protein KM043_005452 [Ampulex compressa]|nr:hypothetical protein KM043_005452 [Ampulex compressa]